VRPFLEDPFTKVGLVEWLKVKVLSSSPSTAKKKKKSNLWLNKKDERNMGKYNGIEGRGYINICSNFL
jgi:hypothetical protein